MEKGHAHSLVSNFKETLILIRYKLGVPVLTKPANCGSLLKHEHWLLAKDLHWQHNLSFPPSYFLKPQVLILACSVCNQLCSISSHYHWTNWFCRPGQIILKKSIGKKGNFCHLLPYSLDLGYHFWILAIDSFIFFFLFVFNLTLASVLHRWLLPATWARDWR